MSYAARCNIRRQEGVHLVLPGDKGAVTLLFMPNEHLPDSRSVSSAHLDGVIVPTSYGSLAVVGEKSESVSPILKRIQAAVDRDT
ncbi:MAG: DUF3379 family protein [Pseudomonadota bacterium]|nr:DUF3379 family protein [Pseudomonadota bacterium]